MARDCIALALHGGAIAARGGAYAREIADMRGIVEAARDNLKAGSPALDTAVHTVAALEVSGLYVAGRGAWPNARGDYELDACVMDGSNATAGAVAAITGIKSPIRAARAVMEETPHVILSGAGATAFARARGLETIADDAKWFVHAGPGQAETDILSIGTVGCVVRDRHGQLAAATSTGGVLRKMAGRLGDSPIPGAGTWADQAVAVSATGQGEYFLRTAAAAQVAYRVRFAGQSLEEALDGALQDIKRLGGIGGMIGVDAEGRVSMRYISALMKRAALYSDGRIAAGVDAELS
jgi:isoaspartyl peptidase/L-asparaginase-like protein (Ntn-hydrolase superfamily)